jgi:acetyl esterase/lipase
MKKTASLLISFLSCQLVLSQDITLPLWQAGKVPNAKPSADKEKWDTAEIIRVTKVQLPEIAVYLPTRRVATGQAVIICPGGGYNMLAYDWEGSDPARWLAAQGIAAIVLKYRLPEPSSNINPTLSPLMDAQRAIRVVRYYAPKWNIRRDRIGIMGFSAGGHLASTAGTHFDAGNTASPDSVEQQSCRPDFMVLGYPVISMSKPIMHRGSRNRLIGSNADSAMGKYYSGELQVSNNTPPTFLIHATDDKTVPVENSLLFYQALIAHGISAEMHIFPKGGHGFGIGIGVGAADQWMNLCLQWIKSLSKN